MRRQDSCGATKTCVWWSKTMLKKRFVLRYWGYLRSSEESSVYSRCSVPKSANRMPSVSRRFERCGGLCEIASRPALPARGRAALAKHAISPLALSLAPSSGRQLRKAPHRARCARQEAVLQPTMQERVCMLSGTCVPCRSSSPVVIVALRFSAPWRNKVDLFLLHCDMG